MKKLLPREKARHYGIDSLTPEELLTIIIGSGTSSVSVFEIAEELLKNSSGSLSTLSRTGYEDLKKIKGIGSATAFELMACFEIFRRIEREQTEYTLVKESQEAYEVIKPELAHIDHEEFWVIHLASSGKVLLKQKVSQGGFNSAMVDQRIIFKKCYSLSTNSIILCHNHPSGDITISQVDIDITSQIHRSCALLGFKLLDHIIVCGSGYVSFIDRGLL